MQSVTSMFDCTHGPKKDCHACIVGELVEALEALASGGIGASTRPDFWCVYCGSDNSHFEKASDDAEERHEEDCPILLARAVLEKAKRIEDCIPSEEAEEASRT